MKRWLATAGLLALLFPAARAGAQGETGRITGTVTSLDGGSPINGARVFVVGSRVVGETNAQGRYTVSIAPGTYRLRVSAIGYTPTLMDSVPVTAGQATTANFQLKHQTVELEKVIVVGYGTQVKRDVTGAVGSVSAEQIQQAPTTNAIEAIKGRVAGVDIVSTGYKPGDGVQVRIRGTRSIRASNDPLYVLDGVPMAGGIGDLNPADIESIEILKDASATAIYGSRGANGVVLVTSRRGSNGRTRVTYDTYAASQTPTKTIAVFDGPAFAEYKREAYRTAGVYDARVCGAGVASCTAADVASNAFYAQELDAIQNGISTDWLSLIQQTGSQTSNQLSVAGGSDRTQYALSGNLTRQIGVVRAQDYDRKSMRVMFETQAMPRVRTGGSALVVRSTQNVGRGDGVYSEAMTNSPLGRAYDDNGNVIFKPTPDPQRVNPLSDIANWIDERVRTRVFGSVFATANLAEGLDYRINFGPDITYARQGIFHGAETQTRNGGSADATVSNDRTMDYTLDNLLTYRRALGADHKVDGTFLYSIEKQTVESDDMTASGLPYESQRFYNLGSGSTVENLSTAVSQWALQSYMARMNYTFRDRYLLTVTGRLDGSSRLAPGKKYALFPSVAFAWRAIDDALSAPVGPLTSLKLRTSFGRTGNTSVSPYQTLDLLARTTYAFGSSFGYGLRPSTLPNPNLEWERTEQLDAGVDFGLYGGRVSGTLDLYRANTTSLLMDRVLPATSGYTRILQNIGNTRNTGVELALSTIALDGWNGIRWQNDFTFTVNKNEIVSLFSGDQNDVGNRWFIGQPITGGGNDVWYDYRMIGIWQLEDSLLAKSYSRKPGEIRIEDVNGDGKINEQDKQILGNSYPKWSGSVSTRLDWNRLDLSIQAITRQGFMVRNTFKTSQSTLAGRYNGIAVNYWTPTNPTGDEPRPDKDQENPRNGDARAYEDGSFTRIRNITIGFTVPQELSHRAGTESLRIYGSAQNPFTFTKFSGLDPEGRTSAGTPAYRTLLIGANVGF